jgi:hypothetical protein
MSRAIPLLLLWAFGACYRVNFTLTSFPFQMTYQYMTDRRLTKIFREANLPVTYMTGISQTSQLERPKNNLKKPLSIV